jgi:hypothetical protein
VPDTPSALTERIGVTAVQQIIHIEFGWFFREQTVSDHGVDAQIEELDQEGKPTGKLIALQIKTGASYFRKQGDDYVFYGKQRHLDYWSNHSLPCYIILHNPENGMTLWQKVERRLAIITDKGWSIPKRAFACIATDAQHALGAERAQQPQQRAIVGGEEIIRRDTTVGGSLATSQEGKISN